ncbi:hypothetical protein [Sinorhizobium sp. GL28]|uniref:hypothetical protein n=1 Tax=Sinorhizobium sp. GL28 TaxID=1358418 RepID=UPI0012E3C948|nr:hypothetical protein [Sinorhizobium sp. GL28]
MLDPAQHNGRRSIRNIQSQGELVMKDNGSAPVPGTSARTGARNTKRVRAKRFGPSTVFANGHYDLMEFIAK